MSMMHTLCTGMLIRAIGHHFASHTHYRQNQFSLEVDFFGDLARYSSNGDEAFHVLKWTSSGSSVVPVVGLYFYVSMFEKYIK
jgi:hypothetical protein